MKCDERWRSSAWLGGFWNEKKNTQNIIDLLQKGKTLLERVRFFFFIIKNKRERERKKRKSGKSPGKNKGAAERKMPKNHSVQSLKLVEKKTDWNGTLTFFLPSFWHYLKCDQLNSMEIETACRSNGCRCGNWRKWMAVFVFFLLFFGFFLETTRPRIEKKTTTLIFFYSSFSDSLFRLIAR